MKKIIAIFLLVLFCFTISGCGNPKVIDGKKYDTYGLLNEDAKKNPNIQYELVWGNIIWSVILSESIIFPIYFFGFSIWEPVGKKTGTIGEIP